MALSLLFFSFHILVAALPPDAPLTSQQYLKSIRRGIVAEWAEFNNVVSEYSARWPQMLANVSGSGNSFDHVRLRVSGDDATPASLWAKLDAPVDDSLAAGLKVLIAYKGWVNATTEAEAHAEMVDWWRNTALHYANHSYRLAFDVFIEIGGIMCNGAAAGDASTCPALTIASTPSRLHALYTDIFSAIRESNPRRIVAFTPGVLDRPWDLPTLLLPACDAYCMGEWHVIASGPCPSGPSKCPDTQGDFQWTQVNGTVAEREKIYEAVSAAANFTTSGGLPTWTGAFMCGPYNHPEKGSMTVAEQAGFASYYTGVLTRFQIPWAVLTTGVFIDESTKNGDWIKGMLPLRDALLA